jgi:hypothetical protein
MDLRLCIVGRMQAKSMTMKVMKESFSNVVKVQEFGNGCNILILRTCLPLLYNLNTLSIKIYFREPTFYVAFCLCVKLGR